MAPPVMTDLSLLLHLAFLLNFWYLPECRGSPPPLALGVFTGAQGRPWAGYNGENI